MPNLPHDVIVDILLRLPVKSLCRFRCVSKPWHSLISDHHFIKVHINRNVPHNERLIVMRRSLYTVKHQESDNNDAGAVKLDFPGVENPNDWLQILGSCNGLLLVANGGHGADALFLLNPSTKESKELPKSTLIDKCQGKRYDSFRLYGLGYDSRVDDYKVVKIFCKESESVRRETIVSVCTVGTGSWRRIEDSPYDHSLGDHLPGVFLNGALHWSVCGRMGMDYSGIIASLDLVNEEFRDVPPPSFVEHISEHELGVLKGCLCVLASVDGSHYDFCVMEEYGVKESWVIKFSITVPNILVKLLCFPKSDEVLIENGLNLVIYNPNKETYREVEIDDIPSWDGVGTYVESLVSPNYRDKIDTVSAAKMDEDNDNDDLSLWSAKNEEKLIVLMEEEVIKGKKKKKTFTKIAWRRIRESLNAQTNKTYTDEQLKDKFNQLKQRQENFKFMLAQTGVGYNAVTGKLTASEDLWDRLCKLHKFARKFKIKGCPHYGKLCIIFRETAASAGANACPPCRSPPTTNREQGPIDTNFEVNMNVMDGHSYDVDPSHVPKRRRTSSSTTHCANRASSSSALISAMYSCSTAFNRNVDILEKSMVGSPSSSETAHKFLKESMAALNELEDIDGAAYTKAVGKFHEDELWRALFLEMPKNRRKDWVLNLN